jgi:hypothetical protein
MKCYNETQRIALFVIFLLISIPERFVFAQTFAPAPVRAVPARTSPPGNSALGPTEELVDLNAEFNNPASKPNVSDAPSANGSPKKNAFASPMTGGAPATVSFGSPQNPINLKVYFDLNLYSRPGITDLSFENFHSFLFFEATPLKDVTFTFDVEQSPRFYEIDYQITPTLQLRAGKIWVPFDDTTPHNIYGGRVNVSKLSLQVPNGVQFLPDLWTDLGVGIKWQIRDTKNLNLVADLYTVNGFQNGGKDPTGATTPYPSFNDSALSATDNNIDKSIGARLHGIFWNRLGVGGSIFTGRWSDKSSPSYRLTITGFDAQYRLPPGTEFRLGIATMKIDLPTNGPVLRAGSYGEIGQYLTRNHLWKLLIRGGTLQTDDRVYDANDQRLVGLTIIRRIGIVQLSLEHSNDIQKVVGKNNYSFTNLRAVFAF